ncbi:mucin-5AC-like [Branchiostoma floridae]|uniref:Mucin-5AC-like n=1 Tax=Branchiostoma floridae TaxID=7739 RepID=A0A9J7L810_BRAFL|nr:mucin-5AC-like [Branchiostoma floridae]
MIPGGPQLSPSQTCKMQADILFVVDGSSSIPPEEFEKVKTFLNNIVGHFDISPTATQVGVVQYSSSPQQEFALNAHSSLVSLQQAISNIVVIGRGTSTGSALIFARDHALTAANGARPGVPKIVVVMTDGMSADDVTLPSQNLRNDGVTTFAIGVTDMATDWQLADMAGSPDHVFTASDFDALDGITVTLSSQLCEDETATSEPTTTTTPTSMPTTTTPLLPTPEPDTTTLNDKTTTSKPTTTTTQTPMPTTSPTPPPLPTPEPETTTMKPATTQAHIVTTTTETTLEPTTEMMTTTETTLEPTTKMTTTETTLEPTTKITTTTETTLEPTTEMTTTTETTLEPTTEITTTTETTLEPTTEMTTTTETTLAPTTEIMTTAETTLQQTTDVATTSEWPTTTEDRTTIDGATTPDPLLFASQNSTLTTLASPPVGLQPVVPTALNNIDECAYGSHNCSPDATCTDTVGSFTCACNPGYSGDGLTCTDIDECADGSHNCANDATCTNTVGSFTCACNPGYSGNGVICTDDDECADGSHNCSPDATCTNTPGSFTCACSSGYSGNGIICTAQQCLTLIAPAHGALSPTGPYHVQDVVTFICNPGYELDGASSVTCQANNNGLIWSDIIPTCGDIDECADGSHYCSPDATCTDTAGSFTCACNPGYSGDGLTCTDDDECADGSHYCSPDATCTNTAGSFTCACYPGYSGDGIYCTAQQCPTLTAPDNGYLSPVRPHYDKDDVTFICNSGFELDGASSVTCQANNNGLTWTAAVPNCRDVDECTDGSHNCAPNTCVNIPGSFICTCNSNNNGNSITCAGLQCPNLMAPLNGYLSLSGPHYQQDVVTFICKPGYELVGVSSVTCQATSIGLTWSNTVPTCKEPAALSPPDLLLFGSPPPGLIWVEQSVFIPCGQTRDLNTNQRQQLRDNFRQQVADMVELPERYVQNVVITDHGITFELPAAVQEKFLTVSADLLRHYSFTVGDDINPHLFQIRDRTDFTDMDVTIEFSEDLTSQLSYQLLLAVKEMLMSAGVSCTSSRLLARGKDYITFSMWKEPDSTINLNLEVKKIKTGPLRLNLQPGLVLIGHVSCYNGTFATICPQLCNCQTEDVFSLEYEDPVASAGLSTADKLGLAVGIPVALAALAALAALLMFCLKKKGTYRPPTVKPRRRVVSPAVDSFETNIYRSSIDDNLSHQVGKKGPQLNRFRDPDAVYGRLSSSWSPPPSTASSTSTRASWLSTPDIY